MAILQDYQGKELGQKLIQHCENFLLGLRKGVLIWFNVRESAIGFYEKLEYKIAGNAFDIEDAGKHFLMFKRLNV